MVHSLPISVSVVVRRQRLLRAVLVHGGQHLVGKPDLAGVAGGRVGVWAQHSCPDWDWLPGQALVRAAGGRAEVVEHRGHRWHVAGNARAVGELLDLLLGA